MRIIGGLVLVLVMATGAMAQVADPARSAKEPWQVDPRCAVMSAHIFNQGIITPACLPAASAAPYINQAPGAHQSQTQEQASKIRPRQQHPRPESMD